MNCHRFNFQTAKEDPVVTVIASEAKQSIKPQRKHGLLRRFAPRNDGAPSAEAVAPSRREAPEALKKASAQRGRGERRVPVAPPASRALCIGKKHTSKPLHRNHPAFPAAMR